LIALPCTLLLYRYEGRRGLPTTQQPKRETVRGIFLFLSYTTHMMGLAALTLADVESIRFSGPLMITILSVVLLGEKVELRRWLALLIGFVGVMLIIKPSSANFNAGSLFIMPADVVLRFVSGSDAVSMIYWRAANNDLHEYHL
jgi:drug/metabolite transporter (DMT)-like permease